MVNKNCCNDYRYISGHIPYTHTFPMAAVLQESIFFDLFGQVVVVVSRFRGRLWTSLKPSLPISSTRKDLQKSTRTNPRYWIDMIGFRRMHKGTGFFSHHMVLVQPVGPTGHSHATPRNWPRMNLMNTLGWGSSPSKDEYTNWTKKEQPCWSVVDLLMICWYLPSGKRLQFAIEKWPSRNSGFSHEKWWIFP